MGFLLQTPVYGRREDTDIVNDETFGFLETPIDDRSLEERKRRGEYNILSQISHTVLIWSSHDNAGYLVDDFHNYNDSFSSTCCHSMLGSPLFV
jgi:hypothetical protein